MNVAELVVKCLENEGVRHVFALPGEETLALGLALEDSKQITQVVVRHEQGAAFMADVAGRLTSYPGVCLATLGPSRTRRWTARRSSPSPDRPASSGSTSARISMSTSSACSRQS